MVYEYTFKGYSMQFYLEYYSPKLFFEITNLSNTRFNCHTAYIYIDSFPQKPYI